MGFLSSDLLSHPFSLSVYPGQEQHVPHLADVSVHHQDKRIRDARVSTQRRPPARNCYNINDIEIVSLEITAFK